MTDTGAEPLLTAVQAMPELGCYTARFQLASGAEQSVIMRVRDDEVGAPEANMIPGWSPDSPSFQAVIAAVRAVHLARSAAGQDRPQLQDVDGGWDVGLGNISLNAGGVPACVAHGELEPRADSLWECPECGARAKFAAA